MWINIEIYITWKHDVEAIFLFKIWITGSYLINIFYKISDFRFHVNKKSVGIEAI